MAWGATGMARQSMKRLAAAFDRIAPPRPGVVILIYHRVGRASRSEVDLPSALFDEQMAMLAERARPVTIDAALDLLTGPPADDPRPPVVVTFDDGTVDFGEVALPILQAHRVPAVLYLATAFIEDARPFPADGRPLSWAAAADALASGLVTVGSHTHTHALLDRLPQDQAVADLDRSVQLIGDRLGVVAEHFAYPKAVAPSVAVEREVVRRFRSAALAGTRPNPYGATNPHRLARSPIQVGDGMRWFTRKLGGGMGLEDRLRQVLNGRRYAGATQ